MLRNLINAAWDRWANLPPFVRFLLMTGVVAALGMFALRPAYRVFKSWRLDQNLAAARKAVDEVRMDEARDLSLTVLRAGDPRIEAYRILEKSTASLRDPRHADIARALMSHPDGSEEDRYNGFVGLAQGAPLGLAGQAWSMLPAEAQGQARFATVFADRLISENRFSEAASVLLAVPESARSTDVQRRLIRVLIGSGKKDGFAEAQRLLAPHFPVKGDLAPWLDLLESLPPMTLQAEALSAVRSQLAAAEGSARAQLMLARLDYAANYSGRAGVIERSVSRWKDEAPVELAAFLEGLGLPQRLLETFPVDRVSEHPALFRPLLVAMKQTSAWKQAGELMDLHGRLLPRHEELAQRAVIAVKSGDSAGQVQQWNAALGEARSSEQPNAFLTISKIASASECPELAEEALIEAIRLGRGPLPLYADLKPLLSSLATQGREALLMEICAIYLAFEPGNPVLLTQYAYLACLNSLASPDVVIQAMEPLAKAFPKEAPIQCVLATAQLCAGQPEMAAATLDPLKLEAGKLPPSYRAVFLTTELLNGRIEPDDPRILDFPWKALQPSERRRFTALIQTVAP